MIDITLSTNQNWFFNQFKRKSFKFLIQTKCLITHFKFSFIFEMTSSCAFFFSGCIWIWYKNFATLWFPRKKLLLYTKCKWFEHLIIEQREYLKLCFYLFKKYEEQLIMNLFKSSYSDTKNYKEFAMMLNVGVFKTLNYIIRRVAKLIFDRICLQELLILIRSMLNQKLKFKWNKNESLTEKSMTEQITCASYLFWKYHH